MTKPTLRRIKHYHLDKLWDIYPIPAFEILVQAFKRKPEVAIDIINNGKFWYDGIRQYDPNYKYSKQQLYHKVVQCGKGRLYYFI